jgi:hypothetical protein
MVAYTYIQTWGPPKGSNGYHRGLPQDKPWDMGQSKDSL